MESTFAVFHAFLELTSVEGAILLCQNALSFVKIIFEASFVLNHSLTILTEENIASFTVQFVVLPVPFLEVSGMGVFLFDPKSILHVVSEATVVS